MHIIKQITPQIWVLILIAIPSLLDTSKSFIIPIIFSIYFAIVHLLQYLDTAKNESMKAELENIKKDISLLQTQISFRR
jgi:hypothetical protein